MLPLEFWYWVGNTEKHYHNKSSTTSPQADVESECERGKRKNFKDKISIIRSTNDIK